MPDVPHLPAKKSQPKKPSVTACLATGLAAGAVNGLFGGAGGMVLVAVFLRLFRLPEKTVFATAVFSTFFLCVCSAAAYALGGASLVGDDWWIIVGGAVGGVAGALFFPKVSGKWLKKAFALFLIWGAIRGLTQ